MNTIDYIIDLLAGLPVVQSGVVYYGIPKNSPSHAKIIIIPAVQDFEITALPIVPLQLIAGTPLLFGVPKIEKRDDKLIIHADIIASSFFLLSRYEEILKPECRDQHGRFCAKDSILFQQGYGNRPLVDEYGALLRKWLRDVGVAVSPEQKGFSKIYLTHDVDVPFRFERLTAVCKQYIKNMLHYHYCSSPFKKYMNERLDDCYTFPAIINYDRNCKEKLPHIPVESIYFLISAGSLFHRRYYHFTSRKIARLIEVLKKSGAVLGLHVSYEAGTDPQKLSNDVKRLTKMLGSFNGFSRHHFLQWREPEDVVYMEQSGITDDFTVSYADAVGFRVGTCHPYRFINPRTKTLTKVVIHPLEIMECTLERAAYMHLKYEDAFEYCKEVINQVYTHNGELVLLWHNTEFLGLNYQEKLYRRVLDYIAGF
ncbi:MAG: polysaccharide deacetylase family protein [Treponema sp.]|nr:polysaccharide deacetylase family protein [Treponema sp.]